MKTPVRIVKVGGSLLDLGDLAERLRRWLAAQSLAHHVLIVGGGALVDQVRVWHQSTPMDETEAHWICIDLMMVTAHLLHSRMPEMALVEDDRLLCQRMGRRGCTIFGPASWMRRSEPSLPGEKLPASWGVTSDSIAARLAIGLNADELVLLKSSLPAAGVGLDWKELSASGYVDPMITQLAQELSPVRLVDLRSTPTEERLLQTPGHRGNN